MLIQAFVFILILFAPIYFLWLPPRFILHVWWLISSSFMFLPVPSSILMQCCPTARCWLVTAWTLADSLDFIMSKSSWLFSAACTPMSSSCPSVLRVSPGLSAGLKCIASSLSNVWCSTCLLRYSFAQLSTNCLTFYSSLIASRGPDWSFFICLD